MQRHSWLIVSVLSFCLVGTYGSLYQIIMQKSAEKRANDYRSGNTNSTSTVKNVQNSTVVSGTQAMSSSESSKSDTAQHTSAQRQGGLHTTHPQGWTLPQSKRNLVAHETSASPRVADRTSLDLGPGLVRKISQSEVSISPASESEDSISSTHRSDGLMSQKSYSDGFTSPSSASENFTLLLSKSEDLNSLSHRGKYLMSPTPTAEFVQTLIFGGDKLISPTHESDKLILPTTESERLRKSLTTDFANEEPRNEIWMGSVFNDERGEDENLMYAQFQDEDPMQKTSQNSAQEKQTSPQIDELNDRVAESDDVDKSEGLDVLAPRSDKLELWESEDAMSNADERDDLTQVTTESTHGARFAETITRSVHGENLLRVTQRGGGLLNTTQKHGESVPAAQQKYDFKSSVQKGEDATPRNTDTMDTLRKNLEHGRWKQHGQDLIDNRFITTEQLVPSTQRDAHTEQPPEPDGQFVHRTIQDGDHKKTAPQHAKLPQTIHTEHSFASSKRLDEETRVATLPSVDFSTVTAGRHAHTMLQTNNSAQKQYGPELAKSKLDAYFIPSTVSSLSDIQDADDVQTTVEDNDKLHARSKVASGFNSTHAVDDVKHRTELNTDLIDASEQRRGRTQQANGDNSEYKRYYNNVEAQESSDYFRRKINIQHTTHIYNNVTEVVTEYKMAADSTESTFGKLWTSHTEGVINSGEVDIKRVPQKNNETNRALVVGGDTANLISRSENNIGETATKKGTHVGIDTTVLTRTEENDTSLLGHNVATATPILGQNVATATPIQQGTVDSSVRTTQPNAATSSHKLTDHVSQVSKDEMDNTAKLLKGNLAMTTAVAKAHESYTAPVTNTAQLLNGNAANTTPTLKNDVASDAAELSVNTRSTAQTLKGHFIPDIKDTEYSTVLGPTNSRVVTTTTTTIYANTQVGVNCDQTASGFEGVSCNTTSTEGDRGSSTNPVEELEHGKRIRKLEDNKITTSGATVRDMANTAPTITDSALRTTPLPDNDQNHDAAELEDNVNNYAPKVEDKVDNTAHSESDYVNFDSPSVEGNDANTTPPQGTTAVVITIALQGSIPSSENLHPQTNTSLVDSKNTSQKNTKQNHQAERLNSDNLPNQGKQSFSENSAADLMEADEPNKSLASTLPTNRRSAQENTSEPQEGSTQPNSRNTHSNDQSMASPEDDTFRATHLKPDSKGTHIEPGISSGYFFKEKRSTVPWENIRINGENRTHKPWQDQTSRHTGEGNAQTAEGSEYSHSYAHKINEDDADKHTRSTNSELLTENNELTKESMNDKETDAYQTGSISFKENQQEPSVVDSYLTSQKSLLRNTKTLPEFNTETMNSMTKTTETLSDRFHQETYEETGEASNPHVTSSRAPKVDSSYCPTCQDDDESALDKNSNYNKWIEAFSPHDPISLDELAIFFWPKLLSPKTSSSTTPSKAPASTKAPKNTSIRTHPTSSLQPRTTSAPNNPGFQSTTPLFVSKLDQVRVTFSKLDHISTPTAETVVLSASSSAEKISPTWIDPTYNVGFTSPPPTSRNSPRRTTATSTTSVPRTSKFEFNTPRPTSSVGLNSSASTSKSFPASFSDNHQSVITKIRQSSTSATPPTQPTVSRATRPFFTKETVSQTSTTPQTGKVIPPDTSDHQIEELKYTTRLVTTTTPEEEPSPHTETLIITSSRVDQTQTSIPSLALTSRENTVHVPFSPSTPTSPSTIETERPTHKKSSLPTTTLREATSTTSATIKTNKVTRQADMTTPTTVTPVTTTTATTRPTETTTTRPTPAPALELGAACVVPSRTNGDPCTTGVRYSACRDGRCRCVWPRYADGGICVQYSLTNPEIQVIHVTETSITITWLAQTFRNIGKVEYRVSWQANRRSTPDVGPGSARRTVTDTVYVIDKLAAGTEYTISVTAVLADPEDEHNQLDLYFPPVVGRTAPSQVGTMNWSLGSDKTMVTLTFDPPGGHFDHCTALVRRMTSDGAVESSDPALRFDCRTFHLSHFEVGIRYKIDVTVTSGNTSGQLSTFNLLTPAAAPGPVTRLTGKTTAHSAQLTWRPPEQRRGYLTGYDLKLYTEGACVRRVLLVVSAAQKGNKQGRYRSEAQSDNGENSRECDSFKVESLLQGRNESLGYTFTDLRPSRQYSLELFAQNKELKGEAMTVSLTTLTAVPKPPSEGRVEEATSSSIRITWRPPEYPGPTNYSIQVFKSRLQDGVRFIRNITVFGYTSNSLLVSDLQGYSTYWFNVSAITSAGESRPVIVGPGSTLEKVSDPVHRLKTNEITAYTVSLIWGHPKNVFGRLAAYIIFVQPMSSPGKCERVIILSEQKDFQVNQTVCSQGKIIQDHMPTLPHLTSTAFSVTDLQPYTTYSISVAAVNGAGVGRLSTVTVFTSIAVPMAPQGQKCTYPSRGTITFSWDAPPIKTGPTTYLILVSKSKHSSDLSQDQDFIANFTVPESSNHSLNLNGLEDFWWYSFSVSSHTAAGNSEKVTLPCQTSNAPPGPVKDIQIVAVNATSAQVLWQCPRDEDKHGIIGNFVIVQRVQQADLEAVSEILKTLTLDARPQTCSRTYSVSVSVLPEVTYIFQIQAKVIGIDQPGEVMSQVYTAPAAVPKPIKTLPTSKPYTDESSLKESTFSVNVCLACLLDNSHGKVTSFGILVCQDGFCDQGLGDLHNWKSMYSGVATWKSAQSKHFEAVFRATDSSWELQLQAGLFSSGASEVIFEVGNDTSCINKPDDVYCNGPLPAGKSFRIRLFSCTAAGCSVSEPSGLFMTAESDSPPSSDSVVIGGAMAGIAVAVVVLAVVIGVRYKFRDPKFKGGSAKKGSQEMAQVIVLADVTNTVRSETSRPIRIGDYDKTLRALHMNDNAALTEEYTELNQRSPQHSVDVGSDLAYRHDNRWTNILPFDYSRVKLAVVNGDEACNHDYINANYISGLDSCRDYIATQGPLMRTVPHFWRMIWEQNVSIIVMLSDFEELDKRTQIMREKVARYFPGDEQSGFSQYGLIQVSRTRKDYNNKWEIRTLKLTHTRARKVRTVKHFFFKNWSDHEADIDTRELIDFVELLRAEMKSLPKGPMVVHCSAGVGRTGTFIAVHYFHKLLSAMRPASAAPGLGTAANKTLDIFGQVLKMRDCRRFMVQSMSQYIFVYDAVQEIIRRVFQLQQSKEYDIYDQKANDILNILACQALIEDAVYDDVEQLKGQVIADKGSETLTA